MVWPLAERRSTSAILLYYVYNSGGQQGEGRDSSDTDPPDVWEVFNSSTDSEVEYYPLSSLRRPVMTSPGAPRAPTYPPRGTRWSRATTTSRGSQSAPPQGVSDSRASTSQLVVSPASAYGLEVAEEHILDNPQDVEAPQQSSPHQHRRRAVSYTHLTLPTKA